MEKSMGQQLKMIPFGDQQPFLLQLGKLHRHGGTLHAEKIRQLLTVKGNVKGEGRLPDGLGGQVGQQLFPGGALADMGDLLVEEQYFVCQNADQIADELLVMVAGGGAGGEQPLDVQQQDLAILLCHHADVQDGTGGGGVRLAEKVPGIALGQDVAVSPKILLDHKGGAGQHKPHDLCGISGTEDIGAPGAGDFRCTDTVQDGQNLIVGKPSKKGAVPQNRQIFLHKSPPCWNSNIQVAFSIL